MIDRELEKAVMFTRAMADGEYTSFVDYCRQRSWLVAMGNDWRVTRIEFRDGSLASQELLDRLNLGRDCFRVVSDDTGQVVSVGGAYVRSCTISGILFQFVEDGPTVFSV
jgi:hypothetical protein